MSFSHNFPRHYLLNFPDYHQNINNFKRIIISPFQTAWNGDRWNNFSSCKQFHLLTLNFYPLHRTDHNPRQDPSEVESVSDRCYPKSSPTTLSWEARQAQQCSAPGQVHIHLCLCPSGLVGTQNYRIIKGGKDPQVLKHAVFTWQIVHSQLGYVDLFLY